MEAEKKKAEKSGAAGKAAQTANEATEKLEAEWAAERDTINADREALKAECAQM